MTSRGYKRSWKNLLLNKRYQLRFTLFMVGLAAVLMSLLGWWVVRVADEATNVAQSRVRGNPCPELPAWPGTTSVDVAPGEMTLDGPEPGAAGGSGAAPAPGAGAIEPVAGAGSAIDPAVGAGAPKPPDDAAGPRIVIDEPSMRLQAIEPSLAPDHVANVIAHHECELRRAARIGELAAGRQRILAVLVLTAALVLVGLVLFGIKMTHRVAGPLYKVTLYLAKLRDGRYDRVYDLRKGDQLVEFYEHFKEAHAGVVALEAADRARIAAALDAATADGVLDRSPEAKAAADELRAVLARKEKSLGDAT